MGKTIWHTFSVGGDPDKESMINYELNQILTNLQSDSWDIVRIDRNVISRAWSCNQQKMVDTIQYLIIAKAEEEEEKDVSQE